MPHHDVRWKNHKTTTKRSNRRPTGARRVALLEASYGNRTTPRSAEVLIGTVTQFRLMSGLPIERDVPIRFDISLAETEQTVIDPQSVCTTHEYV